jgi:hypothetical protein
LFLNDKKKYLRELITREREKYKKIMETQECFSFFLASDQFTIKSSRYPIIEKHFFYPK